MIIDKKEYEILEKVSVMTSTDYNIKWFDKEKCEGFIDCYGLFSMVEELLNDNIRLHEELESLAQDLEDNYRPIPVEEQYEISDRDFI